MSILRFPMLHDSHNHVSFNIAVLNLLNTRDLGYNDAIEQIAKMDNNNVNIVTGWMFYEFNKKNIEALPPVLICDNFLHTFYLNNKAKILLKQQFGEFVSNINSKEWIERNLPYIIKFIVQITPISISNINNYFRKLENIGVYSTEDMLIPNESFIDLINKTEYRNRCKFWMDIETYKKHKENYKNKIEGIKIFLDGATEPETALINGYLSNSKGLFLHDDTELYEIINYIKSENKKAAIHSVGNGGIQQLINLAERNNLDISGFRLEHTQYITKKLATKTKDLGLLLSMQPNFSFDALVFKNKLAKNTLKQLNPFRMLIDEIGFEPGKNLIFGSDGMPTGIEFALKSALFPPFESQKLTIDEFIQGYSANNISSVPVEIKDNKIKLISNCRS